MGHWVTIEGRHVYIERSGGSPELPNVHPQAAKEAVAGVTAVKALFPYMDFKGFNEGGVSEDVLVGFRMGTHGVTGIISVNPKAVNADEHKKSADDKAEVERVRNRISETLDIEEAHVRGHMKTSRGKAREGHKQSLRRIANNRLEITSPVTYSFEHADGFARSRISAAHEAMHIVDGQSDFMSHWQEQAGAQNLTSEDMYAVSSYAGSHPVEGVAEVGGLIATGHGDKVPDKVKSVFEAARAATKFHDYILAKGK